MMDMIVASTKLFQSLFFREQNIPTYALVCSFSLMLISFI